MNRAGFRSKHKLFKCKWWVLGKMKCQSEDLLNTICYHMTISVHTPCQGCQNPFNGSKRSGPLSAKWPGSRLWMTPNHGEIVWWSIRGYDCYKFFLSDKELCRVVWKCIIANVAFRFIIISMRHMMYFLRGICSCPLVFYAAVPVLDVNGSKHFLLFF